MTFDLAVLVAVVSVIALLLVHTLITGISPVPTSPRVKRAMLDLVPGDLQGTIFELGSGWGTLAFAAARAFPRCRVEAYELSPIPWLFSRLRQGLSPCPNLVIHRADLRGAPLQDATLVLCYLFPAGMARLKAKFERELPGGALVLSNTFEVPGWVPTAVVTADDLQATRLFLYRVAPSRAD